MQEKEIIKGFSKLSKEQKIKKIASFCPNSDEIEKELQSFWHPEIEKQKIFDEFSENTISNFFFPYGIAPNVIINGKNYMIPMVIEESSVVAAASNSAKFWSTRGGFHTRIISMTKVGQVHFTWAGDEEKLRKHFPKLKEMFIQETQEITKNMQERGGGILDIELVDMRHEIENYYQLKASFDTVDSMGANFINSCLEEFAEVLKKYVTQEMELQGYPIDIIMSILSNYTPECLVEAWVECDIKDLEGVD
ncbi:MAG: hydroxymethylglutaryl-CoA reductase, partial [Bacteroidales bacterium]|nr:hydroxymethylglutaryl-CoA reductase [Bacteroidales bacterium]